MADAATTIAPKSPVAASSTAGPTKPQTNAALTAAPFKITSIGGGDTYFKGLFYGIPGAGKTVLAASAIDVKGMDDVLLINCESGALSIEQAEQITNRMYIDQIPARDFKTVAYIKDFLKNHCHARDTKNINVLKLLQAKVWGYDPSIIDESFEDLDEWELNDDGDKVFTRVRLRKYRTVIIDSLTEVNAYLIYQLLGIDDNTKLDEDAIQETAGWDEYKKGNQMMQILVRAYRDLPMHVLMVCGTQYNQDELKIMYWVPSLLGKLANQIQGFFDIVGYLKVEKPKDDKPQEIPRNLWIQPVGRFAAKSRLATFKDPYIKDPTMAKIMAIFNGRLRGNTPPTIAAKK